MSIASEITRINTNIANSYTAVDNKNGTLPQVQNSANLASAIDSIEVIEQATAEGESLSLSNTKAMPYNDYVVEGKSEQATRSGKNLASDVFNEYSLTPGPYGYKKLIDSFTKTYLVASLIDNDTSVDMSGIYLGFTASGNNYTEGVTWLIQNGTKKDNYYTNNKPYLSFYPTNTTTFNKIFQRYKIQIELSDTLTPTSYEPYGASPSPDYPSEIHSVADDVNLLNLENIENHSVNSYYYENIGTNFQLKAGETYTLSFDAESDITPFDVGIGCGSSGNYQSDILLENGFQNGRISITFTPQNSNFTYGNYLAVRFVKYNYSTSYTYSARNIKLQKGTVATPYSPYNQGTVTIKQRGTTENNDYTIQTEPLRSLPNGVKDTIEADGIHRRVGRVVLDGSEDENWGLSGTSTTGYYRFSSAIINNIVEKPSLNSQVVDILSNNYMKKSADNTYSLQTGICIATNGAIIIYDDNLKQYTVENFKTWLSTHNTEALYPLAEETIEPLTQNQATIMLDIIKTGSYEGTTNIYTDEDVKPTIGVDYYKKK